MNNNLYNFIESTRVIHCNVLISDYISTREHTLSIPIPTKRINE